MTDKQRKNKLKLIEEAIKIFPKVVADEKKNFEANEKIIKAFLPEMKKLYKLVKKNNKKRRVEKKDLTEKVHPWRLCPLGQHWVRDHEYTVKPSKKHPDGKAPRRGHCSNNPSHKDLLYADEINEMAIEHFKDLKYLPKSDSLGYPKGNDFDDFIGGWTQYWNEVLKPLVPLDPDLVKALIATESGFRTNAKVLAGKKIGYARGLMQITDQTQKILFNTKGELRDHFVDVEQNKMSNPNLNIAAGIRWLFRKKEIADKQASTNVSWIEAIAKYKQFPIDSPHIKKLVKLYERLKANE